MTEMKAVVVGINLNYLKEKHKVSLNDISFETNISQNSLEKVFKGDPKVLSNTGVFEDVCSYFGVSTSEVKDAKFKLKDMEESMENTDNNLLDKFLELFNSSGLKNIEFSKRVGVSAGTISQIRNGKMPLTEKMFNKIVDNYKNTLKKEMVEEIDKSCDDWKVIELDNLGDFLVNNRYQVKQSCDKEFKIPTITEKIEILKEIADLSIYFYRLKPLKPIRVTEKYFEMITMHPESTIRKENDYYVDSDGRPVEIIEE